MYETPTGLGNRGAGWLYHGPRMTPVTTTPHPPLDETDRAVIVDKATTTLVKGFSRYTAEFKALTRKAKGWFERCEWAEAQRGTVQRLDLYSSAVKQVKVELHQVMGPRLEDRQLWMAMRSEYALRIEHRADEELAETFFNSVTRAVLTTVGVDQGVEFVWFDIEMLPSGDELPIYRSFHRLSDTRSVIDEIFEAYRFAVPWVDPEGQAEQIARRVNTLLTEHWVHPRFDVIEIAEPVFYRNKGAYLVGRIRRSMRVIPFVLALSSTSEGVRVDAVLMSEDLVSMIFSFSRSYMFVDPVRPIELIGFLRSIMPLKPVAELYIALGYVKHGKTVRYRHLYRHLKFSRDQFRIADGTRGMVMICFTLPSYDIVFKIIRDKFDFPKKSSKAEVKASYDLIFKHNRVGRLVDAQEFEHLRFERARFDEALLEELATEAKELVEITEDEVIIHHVYTERRLIPLNIYVKMVSLERAKAAVEEYGQAIKDLAAANVFPGDLLIKNFGVTRHGRVVFYDYDEVCKLEQCHFRALPANYDSYGTHGEMSLFVEDNDIFPAEFRNFLWPAGPLRQHFEQAHPDLFDVHFWRETQARVAEGEIMDIFPYPDDVRL